MEELYRIYARIKNGRVTGFFLDCAENPNPDDILIYSGDSPAIPDVEVFDDCGLPQYIVENGSLVFSPDEAGRSAVKAQQEAEALKAELKDTATVLLDALEEILSAKSATALIAVLAKLRTTYADVLSRRAEIRERLEALTK